MNDKEMIMKKKNKNKDENINDILKDLRKNIKPSTGPLTSIDLKKLAKVAEDLKVAREIEKIVKRPPKKKNKK